MSVFLTEAPWKALVKKHKLKDRGLQKALNKFQGFKKRGDPQEYSDQLSALKDVVTILTKLKKEKGLAKDVAEYLKQLEKAAKVELKKVAAAKAKHERTAAKGGALTIDVQVIGVDWDNSPITGFQSFLEFVAPGFKKVTVSKDFKGGIASFDDISIAPEGAIRLMAVSKGKATLAPQGVAKYKVKGKGVMQFKAVQDGGQFKKKAKTADEATKKAGAKGTVGADFKVFSVGGEVTTEKERKKVHEQEVEWTVKFGKDSFTVKQVK